MPANPQQWKDIDMDDIDDIDDIEDIEAYEPKIVLGSRLLRCAECGVEFRVFGGQYMATCGATECLRSYLVAGKGSINSPEYKQFMDYCYKVISERGCKGGNDVEMSKKLTCI